MFFSLFSVSFLSSSQECKLHEGKNFVSFTFVSLVLSTVVEYVFSEWVSEWIFQKWSDTHLSSLEDRKVKILFTSHLVYLASHRAGTSYGAHVNFHMGSHGSFSPKSLVPGALGLTAGPQDCNPHSIREQWLYLNLLGGVLKGKQLTPTRANASLRRVPNDL